MKSVVLESSNHLYLLKKYQLCTEADLLLLAVINLPFWQAKPVLPIVACVNVTGILIMLTTVAGSMSTYYLCFCLYKFTSYIIKP